MPLVCSFLNKDPQHHSVKIFHGFSCLYISVKNSWNELMRFLENFQGLKKEICLMLCGCSFSYKAVEIKNPEYSPILHPMYVWICNLNFTMYFPEFWYTLFQNIVVLCILLQSTVLVFPNFFPVMMRGNTHETLSSSN